MSAPIATFNKHQWSFEWPQFWIILLATVLIILDMIIIGMEIGNTVVDVYRSTAFAGFIVCLPFMALAIFIVITAYRPRMLFFHIAFVLGVIVIVLCILLIDYDVFILIDPTRCFFFNCNQAPVVVSDTQTVTGWPLNVSWPVYFQNNMNNKRIFASIQLLCSILFILVCCLYLVIFLIYRNINLYQRQVRYITNSSFVSDELDKSFHYRTDLPKREDSVRKGPRIVHLPPRTHSMDHSQSTTHWIRDQRRRRPVILSPEE